jgi:ParB family chromosome partitioning protein
MSTQKRKSLGRGLNALLGDDKEPQSGSGQGGGTPGQVPIEFLHPGKYQPRHVMDDVTTGALANSIAEKGVLQPLLVRPHPVHANQFEIIAGERRWRAAQRAKLHQVPVIIREFTDVEALEVGLIENLQRQDLSPIEEAQGYQRLLDEFKHTQEKLANVVGKSRSHVANILRLLNLPEAIKGMVEEGLLSAGHARALLGAENPVTLAKKIIHEDLNVRQAEKLALGSQDPKRSRPAKLAKDADMVALERNMSGLLGLRVNINGGKSGGTLTIHYKTLNQLDSVLHLIGHQNTSLFNSPDE